MVDYLWYMVDNTVEPIFNSDRSKQFVFWCNFVLIIQCIASDCDFNTNISQELGKLTHTNIPKLHALYPTNVLCQSVIIFRFVQF